jgi:hypothetical protein
MTIKIFVPVLFLLSYACDREIEINNKNITGTWQASEFESEIPSIPPEYKEAGEKEFLSSVYTLREDHSMEMRSDYYNNGAFGRWEFNPDSKEISMIYQYDTTEGIEKYIITYLSENKMVLHQDIDANEFKGYVQLTLKR